MSVSLRSDDRWVYNNGVTRRKDSPYSDSDFCPYPDGLGSTGPAPEWLAQNEGRKVEDVGLHYPTDSVRSPRGGQGTQD